MDSPAHALFHTAPTVDKEAIVNAIYNQEFLRLPISFPLESRISSLMNDVHPIFRRSLWEDDSLYETLLPGLKLASLFITDRAISRHWHTTCFGRRTTGPEQPGAQSQTWQRRPVVLPSETWTPALQANFESIMQDLSGQLSFEFAPLEDDKARAIHNPHWSGKERFSRIVIRDTFEEYAKRILTNNDHDPDAVLRFYFHLAVTLTHELAHALEYQFIPDTQEACREPHTWEEAGTEWELSVFGGQTDTYDKPGDSQSHFCLFTLDSEGNHNETMGIPMLWIWKIQQSATWQEPESNLKEFLDLGTLKQELGL